MAAAHAPSGHPATPLPVPPEAAQVVLFGGTFDPPTLAHAEIASHARDAAAGPGAWLVFVPAARSPFKPIAPTADHHRAAMLRLAADRLDRAAVWTDEIDRAEQRHPSYWVDTLRRAAEARPDARLWFIIGADQAAAFDRWRDPREILTLARPIVALREPIASRTDLEAALRRARCWSDPEVDRWLDAVADTPTIAGSATQAREALANPGATPEALGQLLDPRVLEYIRTHDLYS